jgi:hypothetical protein
MYTGSGMTWSWIDRLAGPTQKHASNGPALLFCKLVSLSTRSPTCSPMDPTRSSFTFAMACVSNLFPLRPFARVTSSKSGWLATGGLMVVGNGIFSSDVLRYKSDELLAPRGKYLRWEFHFLSSCPTVVVESYKAWKKT